MIGLRQRIMSVVTMIVELALARQISGRMGLSAARDACLKRAARHQCRAELLRPATGAVLRSARHD
jgi:hypothetical protein